MLDYRLETFLHLCTTMNYTRTARELHMTQPAVTQQIQYLEDYYKNKLFLYRNRKLELTQAGEELYRFSLGLKSSSDRLKRGLSKPIDQVRELSFGATLTIGEYIMPRLLVELDQDHPELRLSMKVANTASLLRELELGLIDFALVEGHFNREKYDCHLFSKEEFIGISSPGRFGDRPLDLEALSSETLILREIGSGTREILEQILYEKNLNISNFAKITQIGNIRGIKEMVERDRGISFLYEKAVREDIDQGRLGRINIRDFNIFRDYNLIFLKNNLYREELLFWYQYLLKTFRKVF